MNMEKIENIIEALSIHGDETAVSVLADLGTNSDNDKVRELASKALIGRNSHESLKVVLINKGKGIHDLNSQVVESSINSLIELNDKSEAINILNDTIILHSDEEVRNQAMAVKQIMSLSV